MTAQNSYEDPLSRPLKVYAFDPSRGRSLGNYMTVNVPFEKLENGLTGEYVQVIDYDASNNCYYQPVDLNDPSVLMRGGLEPSESDPRFHQQMVYAVASKTIKMFEFALGRKVKWAFNRNPGKRGVRPLRIFPHALQQANAFYSRELGAVVFGYFPASETNPGTNLPGQTIFTCLSHDIIAHETTHALIDGQRRYFMVATSADTLAFHEAFADIVALFQHFSFQEVLMDVIMKTGGRIFQSELDPDIVSPDKKPTIGAERVKSNPLVDLARQFGEAIGQRAALRSAIGTEADQELLEQLEEPHDRGAILVAAVFDAFFTIYANRVRDLLQIARTLNPNQINADIAKRLANEASRIAEHFLNICIRALDYCPPVDIQFGDFLRALITADYDLVRDDPVGYRAAIIDAFRQRGIRPKGVVSYAEESLRWSPPEDLQGTTLRCPGLQFDLFKPLTPEQGKTNARLLHGFADQNREILGLRKEGTISVHSFHPIYRIGPNGRVNMEAVAEVIQKVDAPTDPNDEASETITFYGGVTLVIDLTPEREGIVRYAVCKSIDENVENDERLKTQRNFRATFGPDRDPYAVPGDIGDKKDASDKQEINFSLAHRGY